MLVRLLSFIFLICFVALFESCVKDSDSYFIPVGEDAIEFVNEAATLTGWYNTLQDSTVAVRTSSSTSISNNRQLYSVTNRYFFDTLYLQLIARTKEQIPNQIDPKIDAVEFRFQRSASLNSMLYLSSFIQLFPILSDSISTEGSSTFEADTINWYGINFSRVFVLKSAQTTMEAVCDSTGSLLAFRALNNRIYLPYNLP
jgi:hypothetical protein